jgi:hypothetical protein
MKTFRYPRGHKDGDTLTVGELKALLGKYRDSMPVLATWEGIYTLMHPDNVSLDTPTCWHDDDNELCLVFDVNTNS